MALDLDNVIAQARCELGLLRELQQPRCTPSIPPGRLGAKTLVLLEPCGGSVFQQEGSKMYVNHWNELRPHVHCGREPVGRGCGALYAVSGLDSCDRGRPLDLGTFRARRGKQGRGA